MKELEKIAIAHTPYNEKFGIPRQSNMENILESEIIFEPKFSNADAIKGLEEYSHIWLIWEFSENKWDGKMTVKPPRLGGNITKGVFATRSSFRPNGLGLSCVKLKEIRHDDGVIKLIVTGADLLDNTPIYDIKPYLPYADSHPKAEGSFGQLHSEERLMVIFDEGVERMLPENIKRAVEELLSMDPRAAFNKKPDHIYGISISDYDIRFLVEDDKVIVKDVADRKASNYSNIK